MWYWDYTPSGWQHSKKPLTKSQIKKLQLAYETAGAITESVKTLEEEEQEKIQKEVEEGLRMIF